MRNLIVHFEESRIRGDVLCPQLLHHRLYLMGPIIFAIRQHVPELAWIHCSGVRSASMRSVYRAGRRA
jgi:hypothetical protein